MAEKKNLFLNFISSKLVHEAAGGKFYNVSIPWTESKTGYLSVSMRNAQVLAATKPGAEAGERITVEGFKTILLGNPEVSRECSICTRKAGKNRKASFKKISLTNQQIYDAYEKSRSDYKSANQSAETAAPAEAVNDTEADLD